jgi:hypothetical protein
MTRTSNPSINTNFYRASIETKKNSLSKNHWRMEGPSGRTEHAFCWVSAERNLDQYPSLAVVSCSPTRLDLFSCRSDGEVYTTFWMQGHRWLSIYANWQSLSGKGFPPNAPVCAVSRKTDTIDLFIVGSDGCVYNLWWTLASGWDDWRNLGGSFPPGTAITAVSPKRTRIYLFACDSEGLVRESVWTSGQGWSKTWPTLSTYRRFQGIVAAVAHGIDQLDIFALGKDKRVYAKSLTGEGLWAKHWTNLRGADAGFSLSTSITAISCSPGQVRVFACGTNGHVYVTTWEHERSNSTSVIPSWMSLGGSCSTRSCVSAVSRKLFQIDVFIRGKDGRIYTNWHSKKHGWNSTRSWEAISVPYHKPSNLVSVARQPEHLDIFVQEMDEKAKIEVLTSWWPYQNNAWYGADSKWRYLGSLPTAPTEAALDHVPLPPRENGVLTMLPTPEDERRRRRYLKNRSITLFDAPSIDDIFEPHMSVYTECSPSNQSNAVIGRTSSKSQRIGLMSFGNPPQHLWLQIREK